MREIIPEEENAPSWIAISAGTTALLIKVLQRFAHRMMDHKTTIVLINAHAESDGGHDYMGSILEPVLMDT